MECPICLTGLSLPSDITVSKDTKVKSVFHLTSVDNVKKNKQTSTQKSTSPEGNSVNGGGDKAARVTVLLSCSHVYHSTCLNMFEELTVADRNRHLCPVCRAAYQKKVISV